jgi:sulfate permease, SulP family
MTDPSPAPPPSRFRADLVAGLTTASVVIPVSLTYAVIAGLPLETGLYVALVPMLVYALLGRSRVLSVSSTSTLAILTAAELAAVAPGADPARLMAAVSTLAMLTGAFLLLAGLLRLGFLAKFISDPVLTGFKAGLGLVIVAGQLPKLLGVSVPKAGFFRDLLALLGRVPQANLTTVLVAAAALALLLGMKRFLPKVPAPLAAVALGIAAAGLLGLKQAGVALTGAIPGGLPMPAWPDLALAGRMWPGALGIALMSFTESIAAGRAFAHEGDPRTDPDRELLALGAANMAGGLFHGLPAGGGTSQTAVNAGAGARSQVSGLVTAAVVLATLLFLAPLVSLLPLAVLAAVVIVNCLPMLSPREFQAILRLRRTEFLWALLALVGVVLLGTLQGILLAVAISLLTLLYQANHPPVYVMGREPGTETYRPLTGEHPEDETVPGLLILRTEGYLNFASGPEAGERMWVLFREARPRVVILELSAVPDIEYTTLRALTATEATLRAKGVEIWLAGLNPRALAMVERSPLGAALGQGRIFINLRHAVRAYEARFAGPAEPAPAPAAQGT